MLPSHPGSWRLPHYSSNGQITLTQKNTQWCNSLSIRTQPPLHFSLYNKHSIVYSIVSSILRFQTIIHHHFEHEHEHAMVTSVFLFSFGILESAIQWVNPHTRTQRTEPFLNQSTQTAPSPSATHCRSLFQQMIEAPILKCVQYGHSSTFPSCLTGNADLQQ